jgi:CHAT domain-containing protein/tetratricopeptide (TPR) repeat protein
MGRLVEVDDETGCHAVIVAALARFAVDDFLPRLKDESERYLGIDPYIALRLAEALVFAAQAANRPDHHALGLMASGDAFRVLGRFEDSVAAMDAAGDLYRSLGDEIGWARTRNGWLRSIHRLGRGATALAVADEARCILAERGVWLRAANLTYNTAFVCFELGRYDEALARYDQAAHIYESLGESAEFDAAAMKLNRAVLLADLGNFSAALQLYEEIREVFLRHGRTLGVLKQDWQTALVNVAQGHYTLALQRLRAVLAAMEDAGLDIDAAWVCLGIIECYLSLNQDTEARELAEETIRRFERHGTPTEAATARLYCALAYTRLGDLKRAVALLDEAARINADAGLIVHLGLVMLQQASVHLQDEDWRAASEVAGKASALFAERGLTIRTAQADVIRARAAFALGDVLGAETLSKSALAVSRDRDVPWLAHECEHILGGVAESRGNLHEALHRYGDAVASIERLQSSLAIELRSNFLADKLRPYEDAIAASLRLSQPHLAFAYLERAKSRALVDYLASNLEVQLRARQGASQDMMDTLARLREEHAFFYHQLYGYGLTRRAEEAPKQLDEATLRAAIQDRERRIATLIERLALDQMEGLTVAPSVANEGTAIPQVDGGTVLLEYFFRADGGVAFAITEEGLTAIPLTARPREIQRLVEMWHLNLAATSRAIASHAPVEALGKNARGILASLYRALIAPVASHLTGRERLIVIPYGPSHAVPFNALYDGSRFLIEQFEVSGCLSSHLLRLCADRPHRAGQRALVMAYTNGGQLPAVLAEARAVAALLPGECYVEEAATRSRLIGAAESHSILHLAAHGEARLDNPAFAHVHLADGQLSTLDVFNLRLHGALVTLSACETGRGIMTQGNELVGLSRGFLYAGASTLVQSLWRVEDDATAELMAQFYRELRAGSTKGAALCLAQRAILSAHSAHPFHWAPFQLVGDSGPL